jgi:SAM-dependent methyltransferase
LAWLRLGHAVDGSRDAARLALEGVRRLPLKSAAAKRNLRRVALDDPWLAAVWPFVRAQLPAAPAGVAEIGCGPLGGFIPELRSAGYDAIGIDPEAPDGDWYRRAEFERCEIGPVAAIVACTSLHHVADLSEAMDRIEAALAPDGVLVVVEWARERFDEATAQWCEDRLPPPGPDPGWLTRHCAEWRESGLAWQEFLRGWAEAGGLHEGRQILRELRARFDSGPVTYGPFYFADLAGVSEAGEQAAIDAGVIQPGRIQYSGRRRD